MTQPRTGLAAEGEAHVSLSVNERFGGAGVRTDLREPFAEDGSGAPAVAAAEASGGDPPRHPPAVRGQVGHGAEVSAVG